MSAEAVFDRHGVTVCCGVDIHSCAAEFRVSLAASVDHREFEAQFGHRATIVVRTGAATVQAYAYASDLRVLGARMLEVAQAMEDGL